MLPCSPIGAQTWRKQLVNKKSNEYTDSFIVLDTSNQHWIGIGKMEVQYTQNTDPMPIAIAEPTAATPTERITPEDSFTFSE